MTAKQFLVAEITLEKTTDKEFGATVVCGLHFTLCPSLMSTFNDYRELI